MSPLPSTEDLQLVESLGRTGSLGAASRELQVAQPSASQRLARLERRVGVPLFHRSSRGSEPTEAGREMLAQATHILGHLDRAFGLVRQAAQADTLVVGTFPSVAAAFFPVLDQALDELGLDQRVDHGEHLIAWVAEHSMHGAFVGLAGQTELPPGLMTTAVGSDRLVVLVPSGVDGPSRGRAAFRGRRVVYATYDLGGPALGERLTGLGATAKRAGTAPTAVEMARRSGALAVVPQSAVLVPGRHEEVVALPFRTTINLSLVTSASPPPSLIGAVPAIRRGLGLR